jgi:hypothetical protein
MEQLELGITPLTKELMEGLKVAFFVDVKRWRQKSRRKRKEINIGVVKWFNGSEVVIEGITLPGYYNRALDKIFEVHQNINLGMFK